MNISKKLFAFIFILIASFVIVFVFVGFVQFKPGFLNFFPIFPPDGLKIGNCTLEEAGVDYQGYKLLLNSYKDPFIVHLRTSFANYLQGSKEGIGELAITGGIAENTLDGLENIDKSYLESKFIVYWVENQAIGGGKNISIVFVNKPDKVFKAWVYRLANEEFELRGIWEVSFTQGQLKSISEDIECYRGDEKFQL
jgi:membrane-associated protease RseP (regulator of RpoE activity)